MIGTTKSQFCAKVKGEDYIFNILQNISYKKIEEVDFVKINPNYIVHKLIVTKSKLNKGESNEILIERGYKMHSESEFKVFPTIKQDNPKEIEHYSDTIDDYCKSMGLELITKNLNMRTDDKLIIGIGNLSVLETSITLHHVYGVPYLPGQAIKGIFRRYFIDEVIKSESKNPIHPESGQTIDKNKLYRMLFGQNVDAQGKEDNETQKSGIIFFDSFPIDEYKMEKDIINIHYKNYYEEKGFPDGTENLNIVNFYAVKDTKFKILCALSKKVFAENISILSLKGYIVDLLVEALKDQGIGAKTSVGYGYMKKIE